MYYAKIIHEVAQHECSLDVDERFPEEQITLDTPKTNNLENGSLWNSIDTSLYLHGSTEMKWKMIRAFQQHGYDNFGSIGTMHITKICIHIMQEIPGIFVKIVMKTNCCVFCLKSKGGKLWNDLPENLKSLQNSLSASKKQLKIWIEKQNLQT